MIETKFLFFFLLLLCCVNIFSTSLMFKWKHLNHICHKTGNICNLRIECVYYLAHYSCIYSHIKKEVFKSNQTIHHNSQPKLLKGSCLCVCVCLYIYNVYNRMSTPIVLSNFIFFIYHLFPYKNHLARYPTVNVYIHTICLVANINSTFGFVWEHNNFW